MQYPKIHSLWKREGWYFDEEAKKNPEKQKDRQSFIIGDYALPEFGNINIWDVEEKIDGTNIRIFFKNGMVRIGGRTENAQIPTFLLDYLQEKFTDSLMQARFKSSDGSFPEVILFGEGFGPKIQSGGYYLGKPGFCLYDVKVDKWWLEKQVVRHQTAEALGVYAPPAFGEMTIPQIVEFVKQKHFSRFAMNDPKHEHIMEGVVCRPCPMMLQRNGDPIMFKLKCKEFPNNSKE